MADRDAELSGAGDTVAGVTGVDGEFAFCGSGAEASAATGFVGTTIGAGDVVSTASDSTLANPIAAARATGAAKATRREP